MMESPVRIKKGAAVVLAVFCCLQVCYGFPNLKSNELVERNEQNATITSNVQFQDKTNNTFRFIPRNNTIIFQRKNITNIAESFTPTSILVNNTSTIRNNDPELVSTTPSGSKISFRGSVKYFTTRTPFKPKIPLMRRNITKIISDSSDITDVNVTTDAPTRATTSKVIESIKEKHKYVEPTKYARRNSTRLKEEASNKSSVNVTTVSPIIHKFKEKVTTTQKPNDVKKIKLNSLESTRYTRRNISRLREEASDKSNVLTEVPITPRERFSTVKPGVRERQNSIETTTKPKSGNRAESSKSMDFSFNIDKYTSDEFHDINNVYSHSVSPEIEHFIVPENVSDYFVSVGSDPYMTSPDYDYRPSKSSMSLTTPSFDYFDRKFKEVSDSIKQNLADADAEYAKNAKTIQDAPDLDANTSSMEVDNVNFEDLLAQAPDNNTKVMYKNTQQIIMSDTKDPSNSHMDYADFNGTNVFYEMSMVSTESYEITSPLTKIVYPTPQNVSQDEIITAPPSVSNKMDKLNATASNKVSKIVGSEIISRRIDHFKTNGTRKEFLTTVRMRAQTTPKPRVRISLKTNRNLRNTTVPTSKTGDITTTKAPEVVKMFPFTRRRTTLTTVASNIDPILQEANSSSRVIDYTKSVRDNSIPTLRKRGSFPGDLNTTNSSVKENDPQYTIPPTAWALITLRDTPTLKGKNSSFMESQASPQTDNFIKTGDGLQKIDKSSEVHSLPSNSQPVYEKYPRPSAPKSSESNNEMATQSVNSDKLNTAKEGNTSVKNNTNKVKEIIPDSDHGYSSHESITKLPSDITTPIYDILPDSTSINFMPLDYYGPTGGEESSDDSTENFTTDSGDLHTDSPKNEINSQITTMRNVPLPELLKFSSEESDDSTIFSTTDISKSTTSNKDSMDDIMTSTMEISTSDDEDNTGSLMTVGTSKDSSTDRIPKKHLNKEVDEVHQSTTIESLNEVATSTLGYGLPSFMTDQNIFKTTTNDDLDDFSFSTIVTVDTTPKVQTENSHSLDVTTADIKNTSQDIEAASTIYFGSTNANIGDISTTTFSQTTNFAANSVSNTESSTISVTTPSENREPKHNIATPEEDNKTKNSASSPDNSDDWQDTSDANIDMRDISDNSKVNKPDNESAEVDSEFNGSDNEIPNLGRNDSQAEIATEPTNIEVIIPSHSEVVRDPMEPPPTETTTAYSEGMGKFDSDDSTGTVAAITISVIGVVALLLLIVLLVVARGRRSGGGYGQRCTPVSLDSYSLDNVSVTGSTRRKARRPSKRSYGNPAYDESGATSHPMQFAALANFSLDQESIVSEFNEIPVITVRADEIPSGCESKNRFSNVIPLPETRVSLKHLPGDETSDYINANYVRGPKSIKNYYIACQAPMGSTVNDFWRMIWEQNSRVILMLTEFMENGVEKCFEYIPPSEVSDSRRVFGDFKITVKKREIRDKYIISQLQLKCLVTRTWREVTHMWYFWPAKGVPDESHSIIAFLIEARSYLKASQNAKEYDEDGQDSLVTHNGSMAPNHEPEESNSNEDSEVNIYNVQRGEKSKNGNVLNGTLTYDSQKRGGPLVVHCSPGTGRTGAVIACDIGIRDFEMVRTVDVPKTVYRIRRDRANSVQTKDQYIFIYKVLGEYATKLTGGVLDSI